MLAKLWNELGSPARITGQNRSRSLIVRGVAECRSRGVRRSSLCHRQCTFQRSARVVSTHMCTGRTMVTTGPDAMLSGPKSVQVFDRQGISRNSLQNACFLPHSPSELLDSEPEMTTVVLVRLCLPNLESGNSFVMVWMKLLR